MHDIIFSDYSSESSGEDSIDEFDESNLDEDYYDIPSRTRQQNIKSPSSPSCQVRSFACEKHSKWKKKCPSNCPLRKELPRIPHARRKLWSKREMVLLVQWAKGGGKEETEKDLLGLSSKESEQRWERIANALNRSVNSTKKKFMRYVLHEQKTQSR